MKAIIQVDILKVGGFPISKVSESEKDKVLLSATKMVEDLVKEVKRYYKSKKIETDISFEIKW